jgi:long-chain acyl-CoA synthetase
MTTYSETSMASVFQRQVKKYGDRECVAYKKDGKYVDISWNQMNDMVRSLSSFLIGKGIKRKDNIAIFSPNRYEWWVTDLAILSIGSPDVPIYATNSAEEAYYVLNHSESKGCFVGTREHLEKVLQVKDRLPDLQFIVVFDPIKPEAPDVLTLSEALEQGRKQDTEEEFLSRLRSIKPSDLATIIYTSGTTGPPKGVMLSHNNFMSNVNQVVAEFSGLVTEQDVLLSFLPLSHVLERTGGYYLPLSFGSKVAFAEDFSKIQENLVEIKPTIIVSVPRLYEKIHAGILAKVAVAPPTKKALFNWAVNIAAQNLPYQCKQTPRKGLFALKYGIANHLVYSKLKAALGMERLKFAVSGGGPLSVSDAEFFLGMGITVLEGFGLTETTPITTVNRPWLIKPGSVGPVVKDTIIKIGDNGELLVKGPQVMLGYYKNEDATKEVFTKDGFFRTGDIGAFDEDGYLSITGRIKEIIITAGGKNISPQNIESGLKESRFIEQVATIGDRRKYLSALIVPAFDELTKWAEEQGIQFNGKEDLVQNNRIIELFQKEIEEHTKQLARVEQIRKFKLLSAEWTQETGELTPTLKVKRRVIGTKYAQEIESMYQ